MRLKSLWNRTWIFTLFLLYDLFYRSQKDMKLSPKLVNLNATSKRIIPIVHHFVVFSTHVRHFLCKTRSQLLTLEQNFTIISYFFPFIYFFVSWFYNWVKDFPKGGLISESFSLSLARFSKKKRRQITLLNIFAFGGCALESPLELHHLVLTKGDQLKENRANWCKISEGTENDYIELNF